MERKRPKVQIIATGGTISSIKKNSPQGFRPALSGEDLIAGIQKQIQEVALVDVENFSKVLSPHFTPDLMVSLAKRVQEVVDYEQIDGVVVTHGTACMEETSFMVDLLVKTDKPVVFTGSMRRASEPDSDGPRNLYNSIRVAVSPKAVGMGVLLCLNNEIHAARDAIKTHTFGVETFQSGPSGILGYIYNEEIIFYRRPTLRQFFPGWNIEPNVDLIKFFPGIDARYVNASVRSGAAGIVVESAGLGNINEPLYRAISEEIKNGLIVVVASRCHWGKIVPIYGGIGSALALKEVGAILSEGLGGTKARILLIVALGQTRNRKNIEVIFKGKK